MTAHFLVRNAGPLWTEATRSPFLDALASGGLAADTFRCWLAQDYLFARDLMALQDISQGRQYPIRPNPRIAAVPHC